MAVPPLGRRFPQGNLLAGASGGNTGISGLLHTGTYSRKRNPEAQHGRGDCAFYPFGSGSGKRRTFLCGAKGQCIIRRKGRDGMIHQGGYYLHYKNKLYRAVGVAKHSETLEEMVVYEPQYGEGGLWVRPLDMFLENVTVEGKEVPRFRYVGMEKPEGY